MNIEDHMTDAERADLHRAQAIDARRASQLVNLGSITRQPLTKGEIDWIDKYNKLTATDEMRDVAVKYLMQDGPADDVAQIMTATLADRGAEISEGNLKALQKTINDLCWERV